MMRDSKQKIIMDFIKNEKLAVLATVTIDGKPEAAVMAFSEKDNFELIFQTPNDSRKYANLKKNPNVAVAYGWDLEKNITVQYEGVAKEAQGGEINECREIHSRKSQISAEYANIPENKYFKVIPKWIRYWDFKTDEKFVLTF